MVPRLDGGGEPAYDRRTSDRYLQSIQRQLDDLREKVEILDRDGSRGHAVLVQRVTDSEQRRVDLVKANEREHETFHNVLKHLAGEVDALNTRVTQANLIDLRSTVDKLSRSGERRIGLATGIKTAVGIYAAVGVAAAGIVLQVALR